METDNEENKASEPKPDYSVRNRDKKELRFFSSFEEMNNADLEEMANSTSLQRLQNITYLIMNMYKTSLEKPQNNILYFNS